MAGSRKNLYPKLNDSLIGVDVAKAKLDCALRLPNGKFRAKVVPNSPEGFGLLLAWLDNQQATGPSVYMEAARIYWEAIAQLLVAKNFTVSVVNPVQIKAYGTSCLTRTKTDKADAKLIANFCAERKPAPWQAPGEAELALRALVLRLDSLQTMRVPVWKCPARLCVTISKATLTG